MTSFRSLAPSLLVATPALLDPNFHRTVVLLGKHTEEGAFGLIVNRVVEPEEADLEKLARSLDLPYGRSRTAPLHRGGPVEVERGWILHEGARRWPGTEEIVPGLLLSVSREALAYFAGADRPEAFRALVGYAGWGPGQLEGEVAQGAWETAPATADAVLRAPPTTLWERTLTSIGADPDRYVPPEGRVLH